MKEKIKNIRAYVVYEMYQRGILKNHIHVHSIDETIDALVNTNNSLIRFGEGEIIMTEGLATATQESNVELGNRLREILLSTKDEDSDSINQNGRLLISIYDIFEGLDAIRPQNRDFWRKHLLRSRKTYESTLNHKLIYENTFLTRCYYSFEDKSKCQNWFDGIKNIWKDKNVILIEGVSSHIGIGNDLLDGCKMVKRIIGPSKDAYSHYEDILSKCIEIAEETKYSQSELLFLIALGATAKPLAFDLYNKGYRVIDIGNVDLEYEWFLMGTIDKVDLPKHDIIGTDANKEAGFIDYLNEIVATVGC